MSTAGDPEVLTARAYRHPVLDDRTVVRLVGASLGPAEDLSMEFLGFATAGAAAVGHGTRQALGFPAWALIHDPANGRHALALVKEMERLARTARSKPGAAMDGYQALATRLGAAAPQFLPTFWEQAGRAFLDADNKRTAGTCFTEARRAEQVHGLIIDEDRVREVHLEFAFAGALTAAMLGAHAREVVDRRPPLEAYELVKTLSLRRVAGGLPPHASMAADLARLAKAAGRDAEREADEVAARLLGYPAVARSHPSVWKAYRKSLVRLGKRDAAVRARLLRIIPDPPGYDTDPTEQWLALLEDSTATTALTTTDAADGSAAQWLERFLRMRRSGSRDGRSERLLGLVERMLPRLAAEGGVRLADTAWGVDVDVLDLCLAAGVPVSFGDPDRDHDLPLDAWVRDSRPGRRELTAIAAAPRWRQLLARSLRTAISRLRDGRSLTGPALPDETLRQAFGAPGVRDVLVEMIDERTARAADGTVAGLDHDLTELAALWSPAGMALAPAGFRRLLGIDLPALVARTLRAGLPVELAWPAYEAAAKEKLRAQFGDAWPELVVHDHRSAHLLTPDGAVTEHTFRLPLVGRPFQETGCRLVDGDLLVAGWNWETGRAYWASRPDRVFETTMRLTPARWGVATVQLPVPGGGATTGTLPIHPGDEHCPSTVYPVATDGQAVWRCEPVDGTMAGDRWQWREFDPRTGDPGRVSVPAFFTTDRPLVAEACQLRPAPAGYCGSPLGWRDGMVGWRAEVTAAGDQAGEGIDGRRVILPERTLVRFGQSTRTARLSAAVLLPGADAPLPVTRLAGHPRGHLQVWTADGEHLLAELPDGTTTLPPLAWWHGLRARDAAGSAALRSLDDPTAAALLDVDATVTGTAEVKAAVAARVEACLPAVTDATLRERITEVVARAVRMRRRIAEVTRHLAEQPAAGSAPAPAVTDTALDQAWAGLCGFDRDHYHGYGRRPEVRYDVLTQLGAIGTVLAGGEPESVPEVPSIWPPALAGLGALAIRAASAVTGDDDRQALAGFLGALAGTPLAGDVPLRVLALSHPRGASIEPVRRDGTQVTMVLPVGPHWFRPGDQEERTAVQFAADGVFTPPAGATVDQELRPSGRLAGDRLTVFLALLAERGPAPWRPVAAETLAAATGMPRAEAVLLLAGLPSIASWEANFLTAGQRATLGLSAAHAKVAHAALRELTGPQRVALLDAAMPADPAALWTDGPDVAAVAEAWIRIRGRRAAVPEDLVAGLARVIDRDLTASVVQAIAGPSAGDWLTTDGRSDARYGARMQSDRGVPFDGRYLTAAAIALPWLAYSLTWDDPLRARLPEALRLVRERLRHPGLRVGHGSCEVARRPQAGPALVDGHGNAAWITFHVAPAHLTGPDDPALGFIDEPTATGLRVLLADWIDEVLTTPPGAAGDPHDPRVSVPHLVDAVRERFGLDADPAAYYLQVLALPDPTDKAVTGWTGWRTPALRTAQAALTEAGLLVTAKRERAARPVFLPGGWQAAKSPRLPVETWKLPLYVDGGPVLLVPRTLPALFTAAWDRVVAGDLPRYHDLGESPR